MEARLFGLFGFVIGWLAIILLLVLWGADRHRSISHHAANKKISYYTMAILETISLSFFLAFCLLWLAPEYDLSLLFSVFSTITTLGFALAAWIPVTGKRGKLHDRLAGAATLSMIPMLLILTLSDQLPSQARLINAFCLLVLAVLFTIFKASKENHLVIQVSYILVFDLAILATAFL